MNPRFHAPLRAAAVATACAALGVLAAGPAGAAGDGSAPGVKVVNTETVQVYTSPTGQIQTRRVYEQLALTGHGAVDLRNPVSTDNLRNLDGFAGFRVEHGDQITKATVDGDKQLRSVSDYVGRLPLDVTVAYKLNGRNVKPGDVVGHDGHLEVTYTVQNVTGKPQQVTFDDGHGGTVTKTVQVPIPMVGSLTTTAPPSFTNVTSAAANMGGDGKGGTQLSFTMTLFPPIGSDTAVFGYSADITNGVVPRAEVSALPVDPMQSPTFKSAAGSYQGGADTGSKLADGAGEIDSNLLKLRDGAAQLLAGLIKLRDGAGQLQTGLAGQALPGSAKLADGARQLDTGLGQINSGSKTLAAGTGEAFAGGNALRAGANKLSGGVSKLNGSMPALSSGVGNLAGGQALLAAGLTDLYNAVGALPASVREQLKTNADYQTALAGLDGIVKGIGSASDLPTAKTLLGGVNAIRYGMRNPQKTDAACAAHDATKCGALDGVDFVAASLRGGVTNLENQLKPALVALYRGFNGCPLGTVDGFAPPAALPADSECQIISKVYFGLFGPTADSAKSQISAAAAGLNGVTAQVDHDLLASGAGLDQLRFGLSNPNADPTKCAAALGTATPADDCGIAQVAEALEAGVPYLVDQLTTSISDELLAALGQPTAGCDPTQTLRCAAAALTAGGNDLSSGVDALVSGVSKLNAGGQQLAAGAGDLATGLGKLDAGAAKLANGVGDAKDGSGRLADGADKLSSGLQDAADGSRQLSEGLGKAAAGGPELVHGAQRLSDEGTKQLVKAGEDTAQNYGELYATMTAGAQRARSESMAFGAPEGAIGLTAYNYVIQGDDGESGRNWARGVGGLAILGAGAGAFALRRRLA